jgi:hypothetical protein
MKTGAPAAAEVETALEELLGWEPVARSPQLAGFLRYVVERTLAGEESGIKAYSVAVDVFGRPQNFDPQSDPIVRVQARRLRSLLDQYYREAGADAAIRIALPVGRYVPVFEWWRGSREEDERGDGGRGVEDAPIRAQRAVPLPAILVGAALLLMALAGIVIFVLTGG